MLLKELTEEQRELICDYIIDKYCPIEEDHMRHNIWKACEYCPFSVSDGKGDNTCAEGLLDKVLPEDLIRIAKGEEKE